MGTSEPIPDEGPRRGRIPMFSGSTATADPTMDPPWLGPGQTDQDSPLYQTGSLETDTSLSEPEVPPGRRTGTSASRTDGPKQASQKEVGQLVAGLLLAVAVGASMFVRRRSGNRLRLRQPTREQASDVGTPLGRIAYRHIPMHQLVPDLADAIEAAVAFNDYLDDGPLTLYAPADAGLPADLNQQENP